jgi:UDP-glucose 4-epimerase
VIIADNLSNSEPYILSQIRTISEKTPAFYKVDLVDPNDSEKPFRDHKISAVIHFAALKSVSGSRQQPIAYLRNNLVSLLNVLSLMEKYGIQNIVFSSSATVYGEPDILPVTETSPLKKAVTPYGATKQMGEEILENAAANDKIKAIALRYFNPAGAHASGLVGELPLGVPNNLVPFITQTAIGKMAALTVFGNDYNTPDGTCIRDYIHVVDLAKAHVESIKRLLLDKKEARYEVFNIGTGRGTSVMEMITAFQDVAGLELKYFIGGRRAGDVERVYANANLASEVLQWRPVLRIRDILTSAWNWEKQLDIRSKII